MARVQQDGDGVGIEVGNHKVGVGITIEVTKSDSRRSLPNLEVATRRERAATGALYGRNRIKERRGSGEVECAVAIEVGNDNPRWGKADRYQHRRGKVEIAEVAQDGNAVDILIDDSQVGFAVHVEVGNGNRHR